MRMDLEYRLKQQFAYEFSLLYNDWWEKSLRVLAKTAAKKKQFSHLPIDMLLFSLDISQDQILEENVFDYLIFYDGCKEYERYSLEKFPSILEKANRVELEKHHIYSLSRFISKMFWEPGRFLEGIQITDQLPKKHSQVIQKEMEDDIRRALRNTRRTDCNFTATEIQQFINFAERLQYSSPYFKEALDKAKSKYEDIFAAETLVKISKKAFPKIKKDTYDFYEFSDKYLFSFIRGHATNVGEYINENYQKGLVRLISVIEKGEWNEKELRLARLLLVALASAYWDKKNSTMQNKKIILYQLASQYKTFRSTLKEYAGYITEPLGEIFFRAFTQLDMQTMEYIAEECMPQHNHQEEYYIWFINSLSSNFINCFCNLPLFSEETCNEFYSLCIYTDTTFPELNFKNHQAYGFFNAAAQGLRSLLSIQPLIDKMNQGTFWINTKDLPQYIEFDYIYPNGKNGDIMKYIFEEYGQTTMESGLLWHGKIDRERIDFFNVFYFSKPLTDLSEDPEFLKLFEHHIPSIISSRLSEAGSLRGSKFKSYWRYQDFVLEHQKAQSKKRTEIYSQLILQGQTSPKWKSEAQLFALVASIYPDAIYQYRSDWLGMQSLDVFIPSIAVGIEYQGVQHYKPVEIFGGEDHFKHQQDNDKKKRELCKRNGINLIEWPYYEKITEESFEKYLKQI